MGNCGFADEGILANDVVLPIQPFLEGIWNLEIGPRILSYFGDQ